MYDRNNKEALWHVLRVYDVVGKLLKEFRDVHVNSLACVRVKGSESEFFRIVRGVRQGCIMSPWLFSVYIDAAMKDMKMGWGGWE